MQRCNGLRAAIGSKGGCRMTIERHDDAGYLLQLCSLSSRGKECLVPQMNAIESANAHDGFRPFRLKGVHSEVRQHARLLYAARIIIEVAGANLGPMH